MVAGGTGFLVRSRGPDADAEHISDWIVPKKRKMARQRNLALAGTNPALRSCLFKCSNLERGESMKDPVSIFGCWRGFQFGERAECAGLPELDPTNAKERLRRRCGPACRLSEARIGFPAAAWQRN